MATANKFRIKPGNRLKIINEPADFSIALGALPTDCRFVTESEKADQIHWFVTDQRQLKKQVASVLRMLKPNMILWSYYPKASSGKQTDLTRDEGWEPLMNAANGLKWLALVSFNDTWSGFALRKEPLDKPEKKKKTTDRAVFEFADPVSRKVTLPPVLLPVFRKNKEALTAFEQLSFTHKKEYLEWIITAAKEETRQRRIEKMLKMLLAKKVR